MILLVHMVFAAAVGYRAFSLTQNIWISFLLALVSHYFLDVFPHVEYLSSAEDTVKKVRAGGFKHFPEIATVSLDFFLGLLFVFLLNGQTMVYIFALLGALPDGLSVITWIRPNRALQIHHEFHGKKVHFLKHKKISNFWRVSVQVVVVVIAVLLLAA